jgi:hypothetical protein
MALNSCRWAQYVDASSDVESELPERTGRLLPRSLAPTLLTPSLELGFVHDDHAWDRNWLGRCSVALRFGPQLGPCCGVALTSVGHAGTDHPLEVLVLGHRILSRSRTGRPGDGSTRPRIGGLIRGVRPPFAWSPLCRDRGYRARRRTAPRTRSTELGAPSTAIPTLAARSSESRRSW